MNKQRQFTFYNIALTTLAIIICLVLSFAVFLPNNYTYADYEDISNNTIVDFNQLITTQLNYSNSNTDNRDYFNCVFTFEGGLWKTIFINENGIYNFILDVNITQTGTLALKHSGANLDLNIYYQQINAVSGHKYFFRFNVLGSNPSVVGGLKVIDLIMVDLTQMFGQGNEPNIQQANEYFTANYYSYTASTPMPFSKSYLQGYQDGANAIYDNMSVTYNAFTIGQSSTTYSNNTIERGTLEYDAVYGAYAFSGVIGINLMSQVEKGTNFSTSFELFIPDLQGESSSYALGFKLHFAYVDENNNLTDIAIIEPTYLGSWTNKYVGDFILPITTSTLYLYINYARVGYNESPTQIISFESSLTFKTLDVGTIISNSYQKGQADLQKQYEPGGTLYESIYQLGVANGLAQGNSYENGLSIISTTFTQVFSIFSIEILPGIPLSIFILLPLLFGIIMFVLKVTKGD